MRYKGYKIPTYEEALELMKLNNTEEYLNLAGKLVVDARDVNIIICSIEEAEKIKEMDGVNGINRKIEEVMKDYIDTALDASLEIIESVKNMEDTVNNDPNKQFKDLTGGAQPEKEANPDFVEESTDEKETQTENGDIDDQHEDQNNQTSDTSTEDEVSTSDEVVGRLSADEVEEIPPTKLTDEQIEQINRVAESVVDNNKNLKTIRDLPSNNGVDERKPEDITETGESKIMNVKIDPNTGEESIIGDFEESINESFEDMCERISNSDIEIDNNTEITEEEAEKIKEMDKSSLFNSMIAKESIDGISGKDIQDMIAVANRRINKEEFSIYNAFPDSIKKMVDDNMVANGVTKVERRYREIRSAISEMLLDDFVSNIQMERIKNDFNSEIEILFNKASKDLGEDIVGYSAKKIEKYKEAVENMDDPEKKEKLEKVLQRIEDAYSLDELKEYAKKCKIKKFDLEKPNKHFDGYHRKYAASNYNTYSIEMARPILYRNLNQGDKEEYRDIDIDAFFIAFCKQIRGMHVDNPLDHAYMYYVMYNIVLADLNKSENTKEVSDKFLDNVKEVIHNLRERNNTIL